MSANDIQQERALMTVDQHAVATDHADAIGSAAGVRRRAGQRV